MTAPATSAPSATSWTVRAPMIWMAAAALLLLATSIGRFLFPEFGIADLFLKEQDWPVAVLTGAFMLALRFLPQPDVALEPPVHDRRVVAGAVLLTVATALLGWRLVCRSYPLSMDEFMATFDAAILRRGHLLATVPEAWRGFVGALQPQFMIEVPDGSVWASSYLPVNAMALSVLGRLGTPAVAGAVWAATAIVALYGVARRLWPARPDAAVLAVLLLATSSQFLITAMTPYAMTAHLAFNMVWLWLFLRGGRLGHAGAAGVAFLACGLHQVIFHPLFAAPFVLQLYLDRRWKPALFHTLVYAAVGVFWMSYLLVLLPAVPEIGGSGSFRARLVMLLTHVDPTGWSLMAKNLLRFVLWQNPLAVGLALAGVAAAVKARGTLRALVAGAVLTVLAMTVLMPSQGHGWGYRYLHGFLGSLSLLAAAAWVAATTGVEERRRGWSLVLASVAFSLLVLLPVRAWQVRSFIAPYAAATQALRKADVDVVAVDPTGMFYATDLVRNDPWLRNRPKVIDLVTASPDQLRALCATSRLAVFDRTSGFGLKTADYPAAALAHIASSRALMAQLSCGGDRIKAP